MSSVFVMSPSDRAKATLIRHYLSCDTRVAPVIMSIKYWAHMRGINDAAERTLNSFTLTSMCIQVGVATRHSYELHRVCMATLYVYELYRVCMATLYAYSYTVYVWHAYELHRVCMACIRATLCMYGNIACIRAISCMYGTHMRYALRCGVARHVFM